MALILLPSALAYELKMYDGVDEKWVDFALSEFEIPDYVHTIRFIDQPHKQTCGNYWGGGLIDVNTRATYKNKETGVWTIVKCQPYSEILNEELIHAYWWNELDIQTRIDYCNSYNLSVSNSVCWEIYAQEEMEKSEAEPINETPIITPLAYEEKPIQPLRSQVVIGIELMVLIVLIGLLIYYFVTKKGVD